MAKRKHSVRERHCTAADLAQRAAVSLPILATGHKAHGPMRKSRSGKRRAIVLGGVQLLMIAHVVHWKLTGRTLGPVEPSESVQTLRDGIINAGFIFFVVALLSTVILGRWFCGWGCHIVMLQDLCGWMMKKLGIRPKPFRSRLLMWVPLFLALYMFAWPVVNRFGRWMMYELGGIASPLSPWQATVHMTTQDFWRTFPGLLVAIPFLGICGFATVYLLGAKGYCTYGCPYAGFFVPLDRFAVGRIRVTDACEQCGHCTAVCTSNVRVHEEVREYGMVVDPGCMKCLDCVSVCPNDALYFGFGKSARAKGPPKHEAPTPRFDLTRPEEVMLLGVFAVTFFSVFGAYKSLPYLMASGVAAVITFLLWKAWRLVRDRNVGLQRHRLKINGKLKRSGVVVAMLAVVSAVFALQCATLKMIEVSADHYAARVVLNTKLVFSDQRRPLSPEMELDAERAITLYRLLHSIPNGGLGLFDDPSADGSIGWLHCARLAFGEAEQSFRRWIERNDRVENINWALGQILRVQHKDDEATQYYYDLVSAKPSWEELADEVAGWHLQSGRPHEAVRLRRFVLAHSPQSVSAMRKLALSLLDADQRDEGTKLLRKVVEREPDHAWSLVSLARVLASDGQTEDAYEALSRALALEPKNAQFNRAMGRLLAGMRRHVEAEAFLEKARALEDK